MADAIPTMSGAGGTNIAALIQAMLPTLLGTGTTSGSSSGTQTGAINPQINQLLTNLFNGVTAGNSGYTKEQAISDSNNIVNGIVKQALDANMPSVLQGGQQAGLYNDSTRTLLSNDLQARIASQATQAVQQNINNYANITRDNNNTAANIGTALAQGNKTQTTTGQTQQQTAPVVGGSAANNLKAGALATIGGTALKNMPWDKLGSLFGGSSGASLGSGQVFSGGINGAFDPGNMLNAGYGFDNGIGGAAPSFGASLNLGGAAGNLGQSAAPQFDPGSSLGSIGDSVSNAASSVGNAASNIGDSISSGLSSGWDWLSGAASGAGDWFSSLFANGGRVPTAAEAKKMYGKHQNSEANKKGNFANGGRVGRAGGEAYTASALDQPMYDPTMALWEYLTKPQGTGAATSGSTAEATTSATPDGSNSDIANFFKQLNSQVEAAQAAAQQAAPSQAANQVKGTLQAANSGRKLSNLSDAGGESAGAGVSAATNLGGASAALEGGVTSGSSQAVGASDLLGSITGQSGTLPTYAEAGRGILNQGVQAGSGLFGSAGAVASGLSDTAAATGIAGAGASDAASLFAGTNALLDGGAAAGSGAAAAGAGAGAAEGAVGGSIGGAAGALGAPLIAKGIVDTLFNGVTERSQSDLDSWQRLASQLTNGGGGNKDWLNAGLGIFDQFFNPNLEQNKGLSGQQMEDNLNKWLLAGGLQQGNSNTGNAGAGYVSQIGQYLADNPQVAAQGAANGQGVQDQWSQMAANGQTNASGGLSLKNGGPVSAKPGEPDPQGSRDNVKINVSGGEYVIPKDVVDALGEDFFNNLVDLHHTPIADRPATH